MHRLISNYSGNYQQHSVASELLQKNWLQVNVEPLSKNELIHIVQVKVSIINSSNNRCSNQCHCFNKKFVTRTNYSITKLLCKQVNK